ncbi:MAG TPA: tetratricopeptide repeat protein, partial [Candidatus Binatia bacterium]|nr:tetratricopeptide repeat protein [Candidatus Binatia bacterium]
MPDASRSLADAATRRLAAIMFTDIVGFSGRMGADEARMLRLLEIHNQLIRQAVAEHHGQVIKIMGDAFLVDFPSVVHAVQCAQHIQAQFRSHNSQKETAEQIHVRIGIHLGDIVQKDRDVFGDGVNIAKRLQEQTDPDTVCISDMVYRDVAKKLALGTVISLGRPKLKGIAEQFRVYALLPEPPKGLRQTLQIQRLKLSRRVGTAHLRWVVAGLVLVASTIVAIRYLSRPPLNIQDSALRTQEAPALPLPDKPSIVVLPFKNLSGDPEQKYFSDGLTEDLTSDLSKIASLFVISRNTASTYEDKPIKVQEVSRELGVQYVLEGSVRKADGQVRITVQLIDATTDHHLWTERYDRPLKDIFALQDEIVQKIVATLKLQLTLREQGYIVRRRTDNLEAYDTFLRGQEYFWRDTKEAVAHARQMFEKALALDPQYAEVAAWLGVTYYREWIWRWSTNPQTLERALALAQQAIALDDSLPGAHALLGNIYAQKQQYEQALAEGERAIALDPNNDNSYAGQAEALNFAGRPEEALRMVEQAMRLNPHYPSWYLGDLGFAYRMTGRYAEAITALKEAIRRSPNHPVTYLILADSYVQQWASQQSSDAQTLVQALAAAQRVLTVNDASPPAHMSLGSAYLWQQQYERAMTEMERVVALDPNSAGGYALLAETLSRVGRSEEAVGIVEQALRR